MLTRLMQRRKEDEGFTLIELMVVVLIIGILIAIALPVFLGARTRAQDRAAQASLRNSVVTAKAIFTDRNTYLMPDVAGTIAELNDKEPTYTFQTGASTAPNIVSVNATATDWGGAARSQSGTCFYLRDSATGGQQYGSTAVPADCTGALAIAATGAAW